MLSLTNTAFFTKKFLIGLLILLVIIIAYLALSSTGKNIYHALFPNPNPPLVAFGKLPKLDISEGIKPQPNITYKVDTVSGQLDELARDLKVFTIKAGVAAFGDLTKANKIAGEKAFTIPPVNLENGKATYLDKKDPNRFLTIELTTGNIYLISDYLHSQRVIMSQPNSEVESLKIATGFLKNQEFSRADFPIDKISYIKYKVDNGKLVEALSLSGANLMQIIYNRADIDNIPVVYSSYNKPKVNMLVSTTEVESGKFVISNIEKYRFSTYPLKGVKKAYEDLKAGKAILNKIFEGSEFPIRNVFLAYLDTDLTTTFLQPVYVFGSDDNLAAYVPAISNDYLISK